MPLYFFHIREGNELLMDPEGSHLPDLEAARSEAFECARQLISDAVLAGSPLGMERNIQIDDEAGQAVLSVPFRDVIHRADKI